MAGPLETKGAATQRYAGGDPRTTVIPAPAGYLDQRHNPTATDVQRLQAGWLSRRFLLCPAMASAVAALAFSVTEAR